MKVLKTRINTKSDQTSRLVFKGLPKEQTDAESSQIKAVEIEQTGSINEDPQQTNKVVTVNQLANVKIKRVNPITNWITHTMTGGANLDGNEQEIQNTKCSNNDEGNVTGESLNILKDVQIAKRPAFKMPKWLQSYFEYEGHVEGSQNQRQSIAMTCKTCKSDDAAQTSTTIRGPPFFNFYSHLKSSRGNVGDSGKPKPWTDVGTNCGDFLFEPKKMTKPTNDDAYPMNHPIQKNFLRDVIDCVAIDSLPLDFIERPTFIKLIRNLNKSIRIVSRRTVGRKLIEYYREFEAKLKRHLPKRHTARAIRNVFDHVITKTFEIGSDKVGFVCGDNAINVIAAFKHLQPIAFNMTEIDYDDAEVDDEDEWEGFDEYFQDGKISDSDDRNENSEVISGLNNWANSTITKLPCYAHLLQLIIKDSLNSSPVVASLVKDAKALKKYFHSSPYWYDQLKQQAVKGLVNQADTRWSTVYYMLERLSDPKVQEAVSKVLNETRKSKNPCKVSFSAADYKKFKIIANLLAPFMDLTNQLQSDKVTSPLVVPGISFAYSSSSQSFARIGEKDLVEAKSTSAESHDTDGRSRIFTDAIFKNDNLILLQTPQEIASIQATVTKIMQEMYWKEVCKARGMEESCAETDIRELSSQELQRYLDLPNEDETINPLDFWRLNQHNLLILAKLAKIFLGFPASSGSVERLFSITGALQRSRTASLKWSTLEMMLCYRDMRVLELFDRFG
ncbi:unnamed protein product [Allacma fusca]|uniref:HAT C-terminal dimerisation domain-containing protein n=1 Tax=Allacma fusca TaxID=39272 RepID=A0A8J2P8M2_9HEXA|nr:unnamed protein product [Allacma fusca]